MTDLVQEFKHIERDFRKGISLPDQDEFSHSDSEPPTHSEEELNAPVFDDNVGLLGDNAGLLAEIESLEGLEGPEPGRRTYR